MKTRKILSLFAALLIGVMLNAQTNDTRGDIKKTPPSKTKVEPMHHIIIANPYMLNSNDPGNEYFKCMKKQEIVINIDPNKRRLPICYPIHRRRPVPNPEIPYETLSGSGKFQDKR